MAKRRRSTLDQGGSPVNQAEPVSLKEHSSLVEPITWVDETIGLWQSGELSKAKQRCLEALARQPMHPQAAGILGAIAHQQGDVQTSLACYQALDRMTDHSEAILLAIAGTLGQVGRQAESVDYLQRAAQAARLSEPLEPLPDRHQFELIELGLSLLNQGNTLGLEAVAKLFERRTEVLARRIEQGLLDSRGGSNAERVLHVCQVLYEAFPNDSLIPLLGASWLVAFGRSDDAQRWLERTLRGQASHWRSSLMLSELAGAKQQGEEAMKHLRDAARYGTDAQLTYRALVRLCIQLADFSAAQDAIREGLQQASDPVPLMLLEVDVWLARGEPMKASQCIKSLAKQFPQRLEVQLRHAEVLTSQGHFEQAEQIQAHLTERYDAHHLVVRQRATWHASQYQFAAASEILDDLQRSRPTDSSLLPQLMLMRLCDGDVRGAVQIDQQIDNLYAQTGKENHRFNWRYGFQRSLLREFHTNDQAVETLSQARHLPASLQVPLLLRALDQEPNYAAFAVTTLIKLRQAGVMTHAVASPNRVIPQRINQYWSDAAQPSDVQALIQSWQHSGASWSHHCFHDQSAWDFLDAYTDQRTVQAFETARSPTLRADLLRLAVLSVEGGWWVDADDKRCGRLEALIQQRDELVLVQERVGTIGNNLMGARPHHPFLRYALKTVTENILEREGDSIWFISGPGAITLAFCHFYRDTLRQLTLPEGVRVVDGVRASRVVAQHLPLAYKHRGAHWNHQKQRTRSLFRNPSGRPRAA